MEQNGGDPVVTADDGIELSGLQWMMHDLVRCPHDHSLRVSLPKYAMQTDLVEMLRIPGSRRPELPGGVLTSRARPSLRRILRHSYNILMRLHRNGYTLRGNFSTDNFTVSLATLDVKMSGHLHISRFTKEDGDLDYGSFVWCVDRLLSLREHVPHGIRAWLDLIAEGVNGSEYLIRYNIALMEDRQAWNLLMSLKRQLDRLRGQDGRKPAHLSSRQLDDRTQDGVKGLDPAVYDQVVHATEMYKKWTTTTPRCKNVYVQESREKSGSLENNVSGVIQLGRNCSQHQARQLEAFMLVIFEDDFPRFGHNFQRAMFRAGQLILLHHLLITSVS